MFIFATHVDCYAEGDAFLKGRYEELFGVRTRRSFDLIVYTPWFNVKHSVTTRESKLDQVGLILDLSDFHPDIFDQPKVNHRWFAGPFGELLRDWHRQKC